MSDISTELEVVVENLCHFLWFSNVFFLHVWLLSPRVHKIQSFETSASEMPLTARCRAFCFSENTQRSGSPRVGGCTILLQR